MDEDPAVRGGRRGGEAALRSENVSAAQLQVYLKGIDYPVGKDELIETARNNDAPQRVMDFLNRLPERQYQYPTDVEQEFGKIKRERSW